MTLKYPFIDGCDDLPTDKEEDVRLLREWVTAHPQIPDLSDEHLHLFLFSNYYNQEETRKTIEAFISNRKGAPELFRDRNPLNPGLQDNFEITYQVALEKTTPEGYHVMIFKLSTSDIGKFSYVENTKGMIMQMEIRISEDKLSPGYIIIFDMEGFTLRHFLKMNVSTMRKTMRYLQEAFPVRLQGIYVVNSVSFIDTVMSAFRPFVNFRVIQLLHVLGSDLTDLYKAVPRDILPEEYGGSGWSLASLNKKQRIMTENKYAKWLELEKDYYKDFQDVPEKGKSSFFSYVNSFWR